MSDTEPQVEEVRRIPGRINAKTTTTSKDYIYLSHFQTKENQRKKILSSQKETKKNREAKISIISNFSLETVQTRVWNKIFKMLWGNKNPNLEF